MGARHDLWERRERWALAAVALICLTRCSPERIVLASADATSVGGGPSATGTAGSSPVTGTGGTGGTGGAVSDTGGTASSTGGTSGATIPVGSGGGTAGCGPVSCPSSCAHGFDLMARKHRGCLVCECAPVSECGADTDCPVGSVCYAGAQCDDDCSTPECCSGNHCGLPTCPQPLDVTCLAFGCADGIRCESACERAACTCDGTSWRCSFDGGTTPDCVSACVVP